MGKNSRVNSQKKGFLALESLISIIISVMALFVILQVFVQFLPSDSNKDIAERNAKEILNFIEFSEENYGDFTNCFTLLKISNLENFQYLEDGGSKNFFYVINVFGIKIFSMEFFEEFQENPSLFLNGNPNYKFENVDYRIDETEQGSFFNIYGSGGFDQSLDLTAGAFSLVLLPKNGVAKNKKIYDIFYVKFNKLEKVDENENGNYLVYKPETNQLFLSGGEISDILVKNAMCSYQKLIKNLWNNYYSENPNEISYTNNKIYLEYYNNEGEKYDISFIWDFGPKCLDKDVQVACDNLFEGMTHNSVNKLSYEYFYEYVETYFLGIMNTNFDNAEMRIKWEKNSIDDIKNKKQKIYFGDIFIKSSVDFSKLTDTEKKDNNVYDISGWIFNKNINGCSKKDCNNIKYENAEVYFYVNGAKSNPNSRSNTLVTSGPLEFYSFRDNFLTKENSQDVKIYFNGEEFSEKIGNLEIVSADKFKWNGYFDSDDKNVYLLKGLGIYDENYQYNDGFRNFDIIISGVQFSRIPYLEVAK